MKRLLQKLNFSSIISVPFHTTFNPSEPLSANARARGAPYHRIKLTHQDVIFSHQFLDLIKHQQHAGAAIAPMSPQVPKHVRCHYRGSNLQFKMIKIYHATAAAALQHMHRQVQG